ncbi:F-box domain-containing protein [Favolaschia claudopus]|uniref:F-box domain-containing protein n=1 Tax=Favolaschia claudopus TaxID=2862362 RepID=A0AAW0DZ29_9AGAR
MTSLATDSARILDMDTEILQFERPVAPLRLEKVYPVLSLPNEIVSEIFIQFLPAYPNRPPLTGLRSPTLLTHICSKWRHIALANPALWRALTLRLPSPYDVNAISRRFHLAETWLLRTGCCPLSVEIDEWNAHLTQEQSRYSFMASRRERWEHLEFKAMRVNLALFDGSLPLLRHLRLKLSLASANITLHGAPLLRSVALTGFASSCVTLPWTQLTSLALESVFPADCMRLLRKTPNLLDCKLVIFDKLSIGPYRAQDIGGQTPVLLPHLHSLALNGTGTVTGFQFRENSIMSYLILPSLSRLEALDRALGKHPLAALSSFVSKSACTLKELCITYDDHLVIELSDAKRDGSTCLVDDED